MSGTPALCSRCFKFSRKKLLLETSHGFLSITRRQGAKAPNGTPPAHLAPKNKEFVPPGQTVNAALYVTVLERLRKRIARVRPAIADSWKPHHENAPSHTALAVMNYLAKRGVPTFSQPPYCPDVAPPDFFLYPRLKHVLKGRYHGSVQAIQEAVTRELNPVAAFEGAFRD